MAVLAVAGVAGMIVWSGGDLPSGAAPPNDPDFTLPPGFTLPPEGSLPDDLTSTVPTTIGTNEAPVGGGEALIATFPVPAGGVEQPAADGRTRTWFISGKNWQAARDEYIAALAAQGITVTLQTAVDQQGAVGELYLVTDPATSLTANLQIVDVAGQIVVAVSV